MQLVVERRIACVVYRAMLGNWSSQEVKRHLAGEYDKFATVWRALCGSSCAFVGQDSRDGSLGFSVSLPAGEVDLTGASGAFTFRAPPPAFAVALTRTLAAGAAWARCSAMQPTCRRRWCV